MRAAKVLGLSTVLLVFAGCDLVQEPKDFVSPSNFYRTPADARASIIGVYDAFVASSPGETFINLMNMSGCIGYTLDTRFTYLMTGDATADGDFLRRTWDGLYEGVRKANTTIANVPSVDMDERRRARIVAEARFLRALYYSYLVRIWGPVPLRLPSNTPGEANLSPAPIEEVYSLIIDDLKIAVQDLGLKGDYETGRATKAAAQALLAKIYLTLASSARCAAEGNEGCAPYRIYQDRMTEYYQRAKELSDEIITSSGYRLLSDYSDLWGASNHTNDGFVFAFLAVPNTRDVSWAVSTRYSPPWSKHSPWPGQFGGLTYEFVKSYDTTDARYTDNLIWAYEDVREEVDTTWRWIRDLNDPTELHPGTYSFWLMNNKKYSDEGALTWRGGPSFPVFRMSEVYLMYAEAENELNGPTADALAKVNAVRERVNLPPYSSATKEDLRTKILDERGWELALEAKDWFDYVRTGTLEERCYNLSLDIRGRDSDPHPRARDAGDYLFPYPQDEVEANPNLSQR